VVEGAAKPTPTFAPGPKIALLMPMIVPSIPISAPPELPGLIAASVRM